MTEVRAAEPGDLNEMAALLDELDRFYGATDVEPIEARLRQIDDALFTDPPSAHTLLAWHDTDLVGMATYSFLWPAAGVSRSLFLKELYVATAHRRSGVGALLMRSLFEIAAEQKCTRVEWATDDFNAEAQRFYEALGHQPDRAKLLYRAEIAP